MPLRGKPTLRAWPATAGLQGICVLTLIWYGFSLAAFAEETAEIYRSPSEGILSLHVQEGTLSLDVREAPLDRVLQEISRLADIAITSDGPLQGKVTFRAEKIALDTALKKLLKGRDMTCLYGPVNSSGSPRDTYRLKTVRIYLPEGKEAPGRLYSYARPPPSTQGTRKAEGGPPAAAVQASRPEPAPPPPPPPPPPLPPAATRSQEEAKRFMTEILRSSPDQLDDIVERLKRENPQVEEQIDQFLDSIEEAQQRARETGRPFPALQDLGELGSLLQQALDDLPGSEEKDDEADEP